MYNNTILLLGHIISDITRGHRMFPVKYHTLLPSRSGPSCADTGLFPSSSPQICPFQPEPSQCFSCLSAKGHILPVIPSIVNNLQCPNTYLLAKNFVPQLFLRQSLALGSFPCKGLLHSSPNGREISVISMIFAQSHTQWLPTVWCIIHLIQL